MNMESGIKVIENGRRWFFLCTPDRREATETRIREKGMDKAPDFWMEYRPDWLR